MLDPLGYHPAARLEPDGFVVAAWVGVVIGLVALAGLLSFLPP
jgi:hypothetical protein